MATSFLYDKYTLDVQHRQRGVCLIYRSLILAPPKFTKRYFAIFFIACAVCRSYGASVAFWVVVDAQSHKEEDV